METSILFSAFPLIDVSSYQTSINSVYTFYQTYKSLGERDSQNRFLDLETFKLKADDDFWNNKMSIDYTYNVQAEQTGITNLLQDLKDAGLKLKDLIYTKRSSVFDL